MSPPLVLAGLLSLSTVIFWAGAAVAIRKVTLRSDPIHASLTTAAVGTLLALLLSVFSGDVTRLPALSWHAIGLSVLSGVVNFALARSMWYSGIRLVGAARASSLAETNIFFAAAFAVLLLGESVNEILGVAVIAVFAGAYLISRAQPPESLDSITPDASRKRGIAISVGAGLGWGLGVQFTKLAVSASRSPLLTFMLASASAAAAIWAALVVTGKRPRFSDSRSAGWRMLAFAGTLHSLGSLSLFGALALAPVVFVAPLVRTYPLATLALSFAVLQQIEGIDRTVAAGALLTILGSYLVILGTPAT